MRISDISIKRPVFAVMINLALIVFGLVSYPRVGVDLFPNVEFPVVTVTVVYPGADPASMESKVAEPIEKAVGTMGGIQVMRSVNLESVTQVIIQFELEVDREVAIQEVRDRLSAIARTLPEGIEPPQVQKFDVGAVPIMYVALSSQKLAARDLTKLADDTVADRIQRVKGVGAVDLIGARDREIQVLVKPDKLAGFGLTVQDVASALKMQNVELPAGRVEQGQRELAVKTRGEVRSLQEIADLVVAGGAGAGLIRISDVADVIDGTEEARSHSSIDGAPAIALVVRKESGANTVKVAEAVHAELDRIAAELAQEPAPGKPDTRDVGITIPVDNSPYIERSIADVRFDLLFGAMLAVLIILFFLHDLRHTLISAVAIPTSVIATFAFIDVMGFTFNNMTMLALSLSIGILIDDAIVVIENIHRHIELGEPPMEAARKATAEIGLAVLATTFSIVAVFVPVAVMKGIIGRFFFQFGLTVAFAVLVSLLVSFTLTPMLSSRLLRKHGHKRPNLVVRGLERFLGGIERGYRWLLGKALRHRWITLGVALGSLVGSCVVVKQVKAEFIPPEDRAMYSVDVELPTGTSLATSTEYVETIAGDLRANAPGTVTTFVTVGGGTQGQVNLGKIQVNMTPHKQRSFNQDEAMAWVRRRYQGIAGALITVNQVNMIGGDSGFRSQPIQFNIRGTDMAELEKAASDLMAELRKIPGMVDIDMSYRGGKPELGIDLLRDRAGELGVPTAAVATTVRALIAGDKVSEYKDGLDLYDVTMRLPDREKSGIAQLENLKVRSQTGQLVDLASVVKVTPSLGPSQIERQARQRQITVFAGLEGIPLGEGTKMVDEAAARVVPAHLTTDYAGMAQVMQESFGYMAIALFLAIVLVYMILAAQFDSFVHPLTIMLSLPLSVVGAFGGLYLAGMTINVFSMIGVIMLMGLVTKNAILLVDFANHKKAEGLSAVDAVAAAGPIRLRPILMTTMAMIFGMLPVALALGEGGEVRAPMAVTVMGGLITSTLLTLVVVPVVYTLFDGFTHSRPMRWLGRKIFVASSPPADGR
ncbi:MAG TPA: efflux RND transporter permease subunit [Kofleriaceae bacterium]|nr:efflux RND transporter permease subunit [Kofleriaceae bacterium]